MTRLLPASSRGRAIALTGVAAAGGQAASAAVSLATIPLVLGSLGSRVYGVFAALMTVPALATAADFGIGNGTVTMLARTTAAGRDDDARRITSSALAGLGIVAVVVLAVGVVIAPLVAAPLAHTAAGAVSTNDVRLAFELLVIGLAVAIPGALGAKAALGAQRGWIVGATTGATAILSLIAVLTARAVDGSLPGYVASFALATAAGGLVTTVVVFRRVLPRWRPSRHEVRREEIGAVVRSGGLFFALSVAGAIAYETDVLVVVAIKGGSAGTVYSVAMRLFAVGPLLAGFFLSALWPAFAEALAAGDAAWVRRTFRRAVLATGMVNCAWTVLCVLVAGPLLRVWSHHAVTDVPVSLLAALAVWTLLNSLGGPLAMLLNGAHVVGAQVIGSWAMMLANVAASISLTYAIGVSGPAWGSVLAQSLVMLPVAGWAAHRVLARAHAPALPEPTP